MSATRPTMPAKSAKSANAAKSAKTSRRKIAEQRAAQQRRRRRTWLAVTGIGLCWLVYAELFQIDAICLWCTSVHFIDLVLFSLIVIGTAVTSSGSGSAYTAGDASASVS